MKNQLILVLLLISVSAVSQNIVTDRPNQTEASSIVPFQSFQLEAGVLFQNTSDFNQNLFPTVLWKYGISRFFELRLITQLESNRMNNSKRVNGFSDLQIGAKIQIYKREDTNTEVAFISHLVIPSAKNNISNGESGTINKVSISHSLSDKSSVGYNLGYSYFGTGNGNFTYSLSYGYSVTEKLGFFIEPFGEFVNFESHLSSFDLGFTYLLKNNMQLDIAYGKGLNHDMNYVTTGFSWNIPNKKK